MNDETTTDATKVGARNAASDKARIRTIREHAAAIHDTTLEMEPDADESKSLVAFGGTIKALGDGKVGGYLVKFTSAAQPDLVGDFFDAHTDYDIEPGSKARIYYNHGFDPVLKKRKIGSGTMTIDDVGVWLEAQLSMRDDYEKAIYSLAEAGKLGWSSGSLPNLVEYEPVGKARYIKSWPLGLDASLTPTPAAGLIATAVQPLKTWAEATANLRLEPAQAEPIPADPQTQAPEAARSAAAPVTESQTALKTVSTEDHMSDENQGTPPIDYDKLATAIVAAQKDAAPATNAAGYVVVTEDEADRAAKGNPFKSLGEQLVAVKNAAFGSTDKRLLPLKAILGGNEQVPSDGGFLVSTAEAGTLDKKLWDSSVFAARAANVNIPRGANAMTFNGLQEDSRAAGSRYGGITGYRVAEGGTITASGTPKFFQYTLRPKKYAAVAYLTDEVMLDATVLEQELMAAVPAELAFMLDDDMFAGLGVAGAHGVTNHACLVTVTKEVNQPATTLVYENLLKMWARRWSRGNYAWFINQDCEPALDTMALAVGTAGIPPQFVTYGPEGVMRIKGAPVVTTEFNASLGTVGDILLADWSQYKLATIGGVQTASSIHVQFLTDQMTYRFTRRVDGLPMWKAPLTPYKGTGNTQSPFIVLETRS